VSGQVVISPGILRGKNEKGQSGIKGNATALILGFLLRRREWNQVLESLQPEH